MPVLLVGWKQIHEEFFYGRDGKPVLKMDTIRKKYGKDMKDKGVLFHMCLGDKKNRRPFNIVGWKNVIMNYFIIRQQKARE